MSPHSWFYHRYYAYKYLCPYGGRGRGINFPTMLVLPDNYISKQCCRDMVCSRYRVYRVMSGITSRCSKYIHRSIIPHCSAICCCSVMAATKESTDKPSYHAVGKEDIVSAGVDRKMFRSNAWEHFGWHKKAIGSSWVVCNSRCRAWVSRNGNDTSNMWHHLKSVHGATEDSKM